MAINPATMGAIGQMGAAAIGGISSAVSSGRANRMQTQRDNAAMGFQERMSNTAYQRAVFDMKQAGLNPMLAYSQGGASQPTGHTSTVQPPLGDAPRHIASAAEAAIRYAQIQNIEASTDKTKAEAENVRAATPTHAVTREKIGQEIAESAMRIERIIEETSHIAQQRITSAAQAENYAAATAKLKAELPQIQATIKMLTAQTGEVHQRVRANLPGLQRTMGNLETAIKEAEAAAAANKQQVAESWWGRAAEQARAIKQILNTINPLHFGN